MLGKIEGRGEKGDRGWDGWMASPIQWTWIWAWHAAVRGVANRQTCLGDWTTKTKYHIPPELLKSLRKYFYRITLFKTVFHTKTVWWELISYFLSRLLCLESFLPYQEPPDIYPSMVSEFPPVRDFYVRKGSRNFVPQSFLIQRSALFLEVFSWSLLTNRKLAQLKTAHPASTWTIIHSQRHQFKVAESLFNNYKIFWKWNMQLVNFHLTF